jgi:hypothetical protein
VRRAGEWRFPRSSSGYYNTNYLSWLALDIKGNGPAAHRTVFCRRVAALGRVDTDCEDLPAVGAFHLDVFYPIHVTILRGSLELQTRGVAPQIFQGVVGPLFFREDVNHHIAVVRHDPLALWEAVHDQRLHMMVFPKPFLQLVRDRLQMRLAGAGANQEKIGERGDAAQVDGDDALRLFVGGDCGTELSETFGVDDGGRIKN